MEPKNRDDEKQPKMPRFNMSWIYIIALLSLIGIYMMGGDDVKGSMGGECTYKQFKVYVQNGYASKILVSKEKNNLRMYVLPEHFRTVFNKGADQTGPEPYVMVQIGSVDQVEQFVNAQIEAGKFKGDFGYDKPSSNDFWNLLNVASPSS